MGNKSSGGRRSTPPVVSSTLPSSPNNNRAAIALEYDETSSAEDVPAGMITPPDHERSPPRSVVLQPQDVAALDRFLERRESSKGGSPKWEDLDLSKRDTDALDSFLERKESLDANETSRFMADVGHVSGGGSGGGGAGASSPSSSTTTVNIRCPGNQVFQLTLDVTEPVGALGLLQEKIATVAMVPITDQRLWFGGKQLVGKKAVVGEDGAEHREELLLSDVPSGGILVLSLKTKKDEAAGLLGEKMAKQISPEGEGDGEDDNDDQEEEALPAALNAPARPA